MLSRARRIALATAIALGALATSAAGSASAGEYSVSVCRYADGSIAPTDGWQLAIQDAFAANDRATNSCSLGGRIELEMSSDTAHGRFTGSAWTSAQLSFSAPAPPGTSWRQAEAWWAYRSNPAGPSGGSEWIAGSIGGAPGATCAWGAVPSPCSSRGTFSGPPFSAVNHSVAALSGSAALAVTVTCNSAPAACPSVSGDPYALLRAWRLRVTLADTSAPAFTTQPALPATAGDGLPVLISATDGGSGVHTAQLVVDGAGVGSPQVIDDAEGRCAKRPDGTFGHRVPCKLSLAATPATLATSSIPNGPHSIAVKIVDAAGNGAVSTARNVTIGNSVPLSAIPLDNPLRGKGHVHNGSGATGKGTLTTGLRRSSKGRLRTSLRVRSGRRARLAGRLLDSDGRPVAGAILSVTASPKGLSPRRFEVRTRSDGTYSKSLGWGRSRRIVVRWYPWADSTQAVESRGVRLHGMARVTLRVAPKHPRNGRALRFTGRVLGAPKGARLTIQVRDGRLWRTFLVPAVDAKGRYSARRTLLRSTGLAYCLRARVLSQRDFSYSAGSSRSVCRRVR